MHLASRGDDLIDVVVKLPRKAIEERLLSASVASQEPSVCRLVAAKALLAGRHRRAACFAGVRFYDPNWDMILELFVATSEHRAITVSRLCTLSRGSTTTALRHIEHLEALRFIARAADPTDRRRILVIMLPALGEAVERWLDLQSAASHLGL